MKIIASEGRVELEPGESVPLKWWMEQVTNLVQLAGEEMENRDNFYAEFEKCSKASRPSPDVTLTLTEYASWFATFEIARARALEMERSAKASQVAIDMYVKKLEPLLPKDQPLRVGKYVVERCQRFDDGSEWMVSLTTKLQPAGVQS